MDWEALLYYCYSSAFRLQWPRVWKSYGKATRQKDTHYHVKYHMILKSDLLHILEVRVIHYSFIHH